MTTFQHHNLMISLTTKIVKFPKKTVQYILVISKKEATPSDFDDVWTRIKGFLLVKPFLMLTLIGHNQI